DYDRRMRRAGCGDCSELRSQRAGKFRQAGQWLPWAAGLGLHKALAAEPALCYPLANVLRADWSVLLLIAADDFVARHVIRARITVLLGHRVRQRKHNRLRLPPLLLW